MDVNKDHKSKDDARLKAMPLAALMAVRAEGMLSIRGLLTDLERASAELEASRRQYRLACESRDALLQTVAGAQGAIATLEAGALTALSSGNEVAAAAYAARIATIHSQVRDSQLDIAHIETRIARLAPLIDQRRARLNALRRGLEMERVLDGLQKKGAVASRASVFGACAMRDAEDWRTRILRREAAMEGSATLNEPDDVREPASAHAAPSAREILANLRRTLAAASSARPSHW